MAEKSKNPDAEVEEMGDEYEVIPDDSETDIEGEHPEGDYPPEIYNDDEFDEDVDDTEPAEPEDEED